MKRKRTQQIHNATQQGQTQISNKENKKQFVQKRILGKKGKIKYVVLLFKMVPCPALLIEEPPCLRREEEKKAQQ